MLYLDKNKLESLLSMRGISINRLAEVCGISRQSIYNMFEASPVFNSSFEKVRHFLNVDYRAITSDKSLGYEVMKFAPDRIKLAAYQLFEFSKKYQANLLLFGETDAGKFGVKPDWNFAIFFTRRDRDEELSVVRQKLEDRVAPYSVNIVNLNKSPLWMKQIIRDNFVRLHGYTKDEVLFASRD